MIEQTPEDNPLYRGWARSAARGAHRDLSMVTAELDDTTLGGLARTLVGLIADGADPRQTVAIELVDETSDDGGAITFHETTQYTVRGDGTGEDEPITLAFNAETLEQI